MEVLTPITCARCGEAQPPAAFDARFVHASTRKTCASCRSGGRARTQEEWLQIQRADLAQAHAAYEARWAQESAQQEQWARARAEAEARVDDGPQPSTHTRDYWLWVDRKPGTGTFPEDTERVGKWMVFVPVARVDEWWTRIKTAVEAGQLGTGAKVATARRNPNAISPTQRVIIVYTYDGLDKADVMRVREALRDLGVKWPISYKLDSATLAGQYARTGARVSLYRV